MYEKRSYREEGKPMKFKCPNCGEFIEILVRAKPYRIKSKTRLAQRQRQREALRDIADNCYNRWSVDDIQYLQDNAKQKSVAEIAAYLGRTHGAVEHKGYRLGITFFTPEKEVHYGKVSTNKFRQRSKGQR